MLKTLHIENYALIRQSDLSFDAGFVVITGETGAGKSILIGALGLLLGQRADSQVLNDKQAKCIVEATFDISSLGLEPFFEANDLDYDATLVVRREILPSAKSRAFVNDSPVSLPLLRQLSGYLIDVHSQHETLTLNESGFQMSLLDTLGEGAMAALEEYKGVYSEYAWLKSKLERLTTDDAQQRKDYDYNRFLFEELMEAHLAEGEQEELEEEQQLLEGTENIKQALTMVREVCDGESDAAAFSRLSFAKAQLGRVASFHRDLDVLHTRLDSVLIELRDILNDVDRMDEALTFSPQRQQEVAERLDTIYKLQRKHGVKTIGELLAVQTSLDEKLQAVNGMDEAIQQAMEAVDKAFGKVQKLAARQTELRRMAGKQLELRLQPLLADLGMKNGCLRVQIDPASEYTPQGNDRVSFLFSANAGSEPRELAKVASGGELSRLMLAIKSLIADRRLLPTIVFDEIDTGISGDIAVRVADIVSRMAQQRQVVAITHLPQLAARAGQHWKVYKTTDGKTTASHIRPLSRAECEHEVAVMLSADPPTDSALQTARELMNH